MEVEDLPPNVQSCQHCGAPLPRFHDQHRITELEGQIAVLTSKAASASAFSLRVNMLADRYSTINNSADLFNVADRLDERNGQPHQREPSEISSAIVETTRPILLRAQTTASISNAARLPFSNGAGPDPLAHQQRPAVANRFSSFLISRKAGPVQRPSTNTPSALLNGVSATTAPEADPIVGRREFDLRDALVREQNLRQAAETKLMQVNGELEDLSVTLFQQANEMVATERRERAKLEGSVRLWEQRARTLEERAKVMGKKDRDKDKRLARLEEAIGRVERVKGLLTVAPMGK